MTEQPRLLPVPEDWDTALVVMAHPDDIEYGAASAVARWTAQGKRVVYLLATRGEAGIDSMHPGEAGPLREDEERKGAALVGVETVEFLDHTDGVIEYGLPLRRDISRAIRRHRPDTLVIGNFDTTWGGTFFNMADHRAVGLAALDAARDAGNRWIFAELLEEGHQPWNGVRRVLIAGANAPTHAVDVTDFIDQGVASLEEHRAYIAGLGQSFDPDFFLRMNANAVGERFGCDYAVSFQLLEI